MSKLDAMLNDMMGSKGYETLKKTVYRKDSDSSLGPLDLYMPLMVLPRTILSWLVQNIKPMKVGDLKEIKFPGNEKIIIHAQKTGRDSYRAEFVEEGQVIHTFDKQTLPGIGGHLLTVGEMYEDPGVESDESCQDESDHKKTVESTMLDMAGVSQIGPDDTEKFKWAMAHENVKELTGIIGKLVDAFVSNKAYKDNVSAIIAGSSKKESKELEKDLDKFAMEASTKKIEPLIKPDEKTTKIEPPGAAGAPKQPLSAQGAAESVKANRDPIAAQRKQGQLAFKQKFGKLLPPKTPKTSYFKNKLKTPILKNEYHVTESELYTPCYHCHVAEFVKSEGGPKYKPCVCFYVTLKSDEGKKISFVQVLKKNGGYSLKFNEKADKETIETFLKTLRSKLLEQRKK